MGRVDRRAGNGSCACVFFSLFSMTALHLCMRVNVNTFGVIKHANLYGCSHFTLWCDLGRKLLGPFNCIDSPSTVLLWIQLLSVQLTNLLGTVCPRMHSELMHSSIRLATHFIHIFNCCITFIFFIGILSLPVYPYLLQCFKQLGSRVYMAWDFPIMGWFTVSTFFLSFTFMELWRLSSLLPSQPFLKAVIKPVSLQRTLITSDTERPEDRSYELRLMQNSKGLKKTAWHKVNIKTDAFMLIRCVLLVWHSVPQFFKLMFMPEWLKFPNSCLFGGLWISLGGIVNTSDLTNLRHKPMLFLPFL